MRVIPKIAFLVHEPTMFAHYAPVWAKMDPKDFAVVLFGHCETDGPPLSKGTEALVDSLHRLRYEVVNCGQVVRDRAQYAVVVSNHIIAGSGMLPSSTVRRATIGGKNTVKRIINSGFDALGRPRMFRTVSTDPKLWVPPQVGRTQVRFMYGADVGDGWSLQPWNRVYDLFLCHGPNDSEQVARRFTGKVEVMGYPRYDSYFDETLDCTKVAREFGLDPARKTVLWMSTTGMGACSIPEFARPLSSLREGFNVIARPHPISFRSEPENIELLRSLGYAIDSNALRDMSTLFKVADYVICDFGGSAFGAIYLDKNLVLLDVSGSESSPIVVRSSNLDIRRHFPIVRPGEASRVAALLKDSSMWTEQAATRRKLFGLYFTDYRGTSARRAAEILSAVLNSNPGRS